MGINSVTKAALVVAALGLGSQASAANLVTNGSFETGDFTGWTQVGNFSNYQGVDTAANWAVSAPDGAYIAYFGAVGSLGGISQNIATVAGGSYNVSFDLYNFGRTPSEYQVQFGGNTLTDVVNPGAFGWTAFSFVETAASNSTVLTFQFQQNPSYFLLDNVQVATPIPAAVWMVGSALFGVFGFARKKTA